MKHDKKVSPKAVAAFMDIMKERLSDIPDKPKPPAVKLPKYVKAGQNFIVLSSGVRCRVERINNDETLTYTVFRYRQMLGKAEEQEHVQTIKGFINSHDTNKIKLI